MSFRYRRIASLASSIVFLLTAIVALPTAAGQHTTIAVYGPGPHWRPDPGYEVHMLGRSWSIDLARRGGRWSVDVTAPFEVTVLRLADCQPILRFTAQPGRTHAIQFEADGGVSWSVPAGSDGPGMSPRPPVCALPDTSTDSAFPGPHPWPTGLILALATALGVLLRRHLQAGASR